VHEVTAHELVVRPWLWPSQASNQHIRMISGGSSDTKCWSKNAENLALPLQE
jgi:hypothetical protein